MLALLYYSFCILLIFFLQLLYSFFYFEIRILGHSLCLAISSFKFPPSISFKQDISINFVKVYFKGLSTKSLMSYDSKVLYNQSSLIFDKKETKLDETILDDFILYLIYFIRETLFIFSGSVFSVHYIYPFT